MSEDSSEDSSKSSSKDSSEDSSKDSSKDSSEDSSKDSSKDSSEDSSKDSSKDSARAEARLAAMQRDEALATVAAVRRELTAALQEHRANELHLAAAVLDAQGRLLEARDTIHHMERS